MKDETVGAESSPLDDFDLDSFLRDNNFLTDGDKKDAENNAKQAGKRSGRRVTPRRPTSDKAEETSKAETTNGKDSRVASDSPVASDRAKAKETAAEPRTAAEAETTTEARTATGPRSSRAKSARKVDTADSDAGMRKADPNTTMSYAALGEDYPEIPFVESRGLDDDDGGKAQKSSKTSRTRAYPATMPDANDFGLDVLATDAPVRKTRSQSASSASAPAADRTRAAASSGTRRSQPAADAEAAGAPAAELPRKRRSSASSSIPSASSSSTRRTGDAESMNRGRASSQQTRRSAALANPQDFQQARFTDSGYRIRGGGTRHYRGNPVLIGLVAVVVIAGIVLLSFGLRSAFEALLVEKPDVSVITLTSSETREAIDSQMPHMLDYRDSSVESAYAAFVESGWNVVIDPRASSNNPDKSATGSEIIHLSPGVDPTILDHGYYQGEFDAYNFDELQQSFNGAWMFDISRGDMGFYLQLEYINFTSASLTNELEHLRASQGLADANAVIDLEKVDDYGNNLIRGYSVIDEVTYYWELVGINFEEYYGGQDRRSLSEASVFVKCRIANFDFYGVSTPPAGNDSEGESTGGDEGANEGE
jgi:hypothetical protein